MFVKDEGDIVWKIMKKKLCKVMHPRWGTNSHCKLWMKKVLLIKTQVFLAACLNVNSYIWAFPLMTVVLLSDKKNS